jgi:hypothetical protein
VGEAAEDGHLLQDAAADVVVDAAAVDLLDGDARAGGAVRGAEDLGEGALAHHLLQLVLPHDPPRRRGRRVLVRLHGAGAGARAVRVAGEGACSSAGGGSSFGLRGPRGGGGLVSWGRKGYLRAGRGGQSIYRDPHVSDAGVGKEIVIRRLKLLRFIPHADVGAVGSGRQRARRACIPLFMLTKSGGPRPSRG